MMPWYLGDSQFFARGFAGAGIGLLAVWSAVWTGFALWHAAKRDDKAWFILFLVVHTAGVVEFIYLMFVAKAFETKNVTKRHRK